MRIAAISVAIFAVSLTAFAQTAELPEILRPDAELRAEAQRDGFEIFKLLPRGMFKSPPNSYKDDENPLGIREGGAYYSFSTRFHSYNRIPQIGLEQNKLKVGFYGASYGFVYDLGTIALSNISLETPAANALSIYSPPKLLADAYLEASKNKRYEMDGIFFARSVNAVEGHTFLLRAISFKEADKLVAFRIAAKNEDGSLTVIWKSLKDFKIPVALRQSEDELREKVRQVLADPRFSGIEFEVKDDKVVLRGVINRVDVNALNQAISSVGAGEIGNQFKIK